MSISFRIPGRNDDHPMQVDLESDATVYALHNAIANAAEMHPTSFSLEHAGLPLNGGMLADAGVGSEAQVQITEIAEDRSLLYDLPRLEPYFPSDLE